MSVDGRDSRRIKAATDKFLKRARKKRGRSRRREVFRPRPYRGRIVARWLVTPRSISLPKRLHVRRTTRAHRAGSRTPRTSKFIKTGSFNRRAHYALAEISPARRNALSLTDEIHRVSPFFIPFAVYLVRRCRG